jgi:O-antigen ligase
VTHAAPAVAADASDPSRHPAITLAQVLPLCAIAWGALAFGGVYAWAYWPLAGVCLLSGCLAAYVARDAPGKSVDAPLVVALTVLAGAILVQLFPLPIHTLSTFSPHTIDVLHKLNPAFAAGLMQWHAISVWPNDTLVAFGLYASLALLLVGTARLLSVTGSRRLVQALTAFGVVLALIGIIQKPLYTGAIYGLWSLDIGRMPFGPFVNRNHFAGWMLMALPLTLALLSGGIHRGMRGLKPGWRHKVLWFSSPEASQLILLAAAAVIMALSLMLTMSRSGIAAFMLSLVIMASFVVRASDTRSRRLASTACFVLLVIIVVVWSGPEVLASRFAAGDWGEFNNRRGAWTDAWSVVRDFPLSGTGLNTYWAAALFYQRHELDYFFAQAHNDYFQIAAEGGLLLILPVIACLAVFVRNVSRTMYDRRGSMAWWLRAGAVTSLLAIACQETVEFSLQMPGNAVLFTIVCAIALHNPANSDDPAEARDVAEPRLRLATPSSVRTGTGHAPSRPIRLEFARRTNRR